MKVLIGTFFLLLTNIIVYTQEINEENLEEFQSYWPYKVEILQLQRWDNGLVIPAQTEAVLLKATPDGLLLSAPQNRELGFRAVQVAMNSTDVLDRVRTNVKENKQDRMIEALDKKLYQIAEDEIKPFNKKLGDYEFFLVFHTSSRCTHTHNRMPEFKAFVEKIDTSRVLPIVFSTDRTAHEFYMFMLKHEIDWPFVQFELTNSNSPLLYEQYIVNDKGSIPQFVFVDKSGIVYTTLMHHFEKSYEIIYNKLD